MLAETGRLTAEGREQRVEPLVHGFSPHVVFAFHADGLHRKRCALRCDFHILARHVLAHYKRTLALPSMRQWVGGPPPESRGIEEDAAREAAAWRVAHETPIGELLDQLRRVREEQVQLARGFADETWDKPRDARWGCVPLAWVVTKTLQSTAEHTHDAPRLALWQDAQPAGPREHRRAGAAGVQ